MERALKALVDDPATLLRNKMQLEYQNAASAARHPRTMNSVTRLIPLLLLCLLPLKALALTQLQASVDRNPVTESEYFMLSVVADDELEARHWTPRPC